MRYPDSIDPVESDGRDVDTSIAALEGEAAQQRATREDDHLKQIALPEWRHVPLVTHADTTYYDRPLLKRPVWTIDIPLYYFVGGAAGAALTLGGAIQLVSSGNRDELRRLSAVCHWTGIIGSTIGAAFLIHDLGRPMRFLFMLRVFRPTSPMNIGTWILAAAAPSAIATGLLLNRGGWPGRLGEAAGYASGLIGAALASYTGVLVSNTAIPIWQESRRWLPVLFAASGAATAASVLNVFYAEEAGRTGTPALRIARTFGTVARVAEIAAAKKIERAVSAVPRVGRPLRQGAPALLWKAANALTLASVALSLLPGGSRKRTRVAGLLGAAGSLCLRFAVHYAGDASARDPRASFHQQRDAWARGAADDGAEDRQALKQQM